MKLGVIREGKIPPDTRVPLTPTHCKRLKTLYPEMELVVQPSPNRCFSDEEYIEHGISMREDLSDCDILMGVKEVPTDDLINGKIYFFFSHTIKEQVYNRKLLQAMLAKNIRMIDYECLVNEQNFRVIGFGRWAGIVGAYNGLRTWALRTDQYVMPAMHDFKDYETARATFADIKFKPFKVVVTGGGRVSRGAMEVLDAFGFTKVDPETYLTAAAEAPVYVQLDCDELYHKAGQVEFDTPHFYANPGEYTSKFEPYTRVTDLMINGIYWDNEAPVFFTKEDMKQADFAIRSIADITCDIAPVSSIPSTLRATTIPHPVFGYDPIQEKETKPFQDGIIDMMTVDNLPNELPRDASTDFGNTLVEKVLPELIQPEKSDMIRKATITRDGKLTEEFSYLQDYAEGK